MNRRDFSEPGERSDPSSGTDVRQSSGSTPQDELFSSAYKELRRLAGILMRHEKQGHTLQATALVHEAYFRLRDATVIETLEMKDFLPIAARAMRQVLIDSARRRSAAKRGGGEVRVTLNEELVGGEGSEPGINDLDRALKELGKLSPRMEQVVEMRIFAGIEMEAIAASLGVSVRTAQYDWAVAKKWLAREFSRG